jgi:hypothetical protein
MMDLFTPMVGAEAQHPYFRGIWERPNGFNCDVLNEWARGFQDRDNKFIKEFQTFNSSFSGTIYFRCPQTLWAERKLLDAVA